MTTIVTEINLKRELCNSQTLPVSILFDLRLAILADKFLNKLVPTLLLRTEFVLATD